MARRMGRSRKLTLKDWTAANNALDLYFGGNKSELAKCVKMSRTTITKFFNQELVGESSFRNICKVLRLNWEKVSSFSINGQSSDSTQQRAIQQKEREKENLGKAEQKQTQPSHLSKILDICHNLPQPDYGQFIGREKELAKISEKLRPYPHSQIAVITIDGIGGIGKSALALEVAHRFLREHKTAPVDERFDAIVWSSAKQRVLRPDQGIVSLRHSFQTLEDICKAISFTLSIEEKIDHTKSELLEFTCRALTKKRTLLIVDNLESVDDEAVMEFLKDHLPAPTKAIITTRHRIDVAYPIRLKGMDWEDAQQLINQSCQEKNVKLNQEQKERLYRRTGGVPLAIVWTIARIGLGYKINTVLASLGRYKTDLSYFCFKEVLNHIRDRDSYKLLLALTVCEGEASREKIRYVSGFKEDEFSCDDGLVELDILSLINKSGEMFTMLPLTKTYVAQELKFNTTFEKELHKRLNEWNGNRPHSLILYCREKILKQYSRMRLLSGQEIRVDQLYVDTWLLEKPERKYFSSPENLLLNFDITEDRLALGKRIRRNPGFEIANLNPNLIILGKPGSGKTTFLKQLAFAWCQGKFQPEKIAILIELRRIRDPNWDFVKAIVRELGLSSEAMALKLLEQGKVMVLMDGLDEVRTDELRRNIQSQVTKISRKYSQNNRFILTCRTQIMKQISNSFMLVEMADFNQKQVGQFVQNWFTADGQSEAGVNEKLEMIQRIMTNQPDLREIAANPVILSLICVVLQDSGEIPKNRASLYKKAINWLLRRWNDQKEIEGWEVGTRAYRQLSIEDKELLLMEISASKFENPNNFVLFSQDELVEKITQKLHLANTQEGLAVLKAIESQHGLLIERADELWSFSHLTFQEYFTVQWLTQLTSQELAEKITDRQWQKVVEKLVKSQQPADRLLRLVKQSVDQITIQEPIFQTFLDWLLQKSISLPSNYKPATIRAFYYSLVHARVPNVYLNLSLARAVDQIFSIELDRDRNRAIDHDRALDLDLYCVLSRAHALDHALNFAINRVLDNTLSTDLVSCLHQLQNELPQSNLLMEVKNLLQELCKVGNVQQKLVLAIKVLPIYFLKFHEEIQYWWSSYGDQWIERLRQVMIEHRNIGQDWQFNQEQQRQLRHYYEANTFLAKLMNSEGAVTKACRAEIEDGLLLPWAELQRRQPHLYGELE
ncbi:MAG: NACHT domain-containing protein [Spirulina sp. SIO3F2]|nr:NACHT domain-containing protein [Spirulina sp. SIO3F2]